MAKLERGMAAELNELKHALTKVLTATMARTDYGDFQNITDVLSDAADGLHRIAKALELIAERMPPN